MITGSNESTLRRRIPSVYSKTPNSSSQIHGFHLGCHIPDFSLDYQKNIKYNSNKQAVSSLTPPLYHSMDHIEIHSRPNILHAPEFFAHPHRVPIFLYIQIKIYNINHILLYFLIITIRHYRDDTKRSEITRLPHGYMKQNEDNARNCTQENNRGTKNIDEQHTTSYGVKLRVKVACNQVIAD